MTQKTGPEPDSALERELRTMAKKAACARGQRLAEDSREIRSLLDALASEAGGLLSGQFGPEPRERAGSILRSTERLATIVDRILDTVDFAAEVEFAAGAQSGAEARPATRLPDRLRVLVAEDHQVNRKIVRLMLASLGLEADFVEDGLQAVEASERQAYDVILMDLRMPGLDGIEAARRIRGREPGGSSPRIVAMSAYALQPVRERCLEAGIDAFLSKPVQLDELRRQLSRS